MTKAGQTDARPAAACPNDKPTNKQPATPGTRNQPHLIAPATLARFLNRLAPPCRITTRHSTDGPILAPLATILANCVHHADEIQEHFEEAQDDASDIKIAESVTFRAHVYPPYDINENMGGEGELTFARPFPLDVGLALHARLETIEAEAQSMGEDKLTAALRHELSNDITNENDAFDRLNQELPTAITKAELDNGTPAVIAPYLGNLFDDLATDLQQETSPGRRPHSPADLVALADNPRHHQLESLKRWHHSLTSLQDGQLPLYPLAHALLCAYQPAARNISLEPATLQPITSDNPGPSPAHLTGAITDFIANGMNRPMAMPGSDPNRCTQGITGRPDTQGQYPQPGFVQLGNRWGLMAAAVLHNPFVMITERCAMIQGSFSQSHLESLIGKRLSALVDHPFAAVHDPVMTELKVINNSSPLVEFSPQDGIDYGIIDYHSTLGGEINGRIETAPPRIFHVFDLRDSSINAPPNSAIGLPPPDMLFVRFAEPALPSHHVPITLTRAKALHSEIKRYGQGD